MRFPTECFYSQFIYNSHDNFITISLALAVYCIYKQVLQKVSIGLERITANLFRQLFSVVTIKSTIKDWLLNLVMCDLCFAILNEDIVAPTANILPKISSLAKHCLTFTGAVQFKLLSLNLHEYYINLVRLIVCEIVVLFQMCTYKPEVSFHLSFVDELYSSLL